MPDLPGLAWLGLVWLLLCTGLTLGVSRWFRWLRDGEEEDY